MRWHPAFGVAMARAQEADAQRAGCGAGQPASGEGGVVTTDPFQAAMTEQAEAWRAWRQGPGPRKAGPMVNEITLDCGLAGLDAAEFCAYRGVAARTAGQHSPDAVLIASALSALAGKISRRTARSLSRSAASMPCSG